jgi:hypothetical protein
LAYNVKVILNGEFGSMWKEALDVNYFKILSEIWLEGLRKITKQVTVFYIWV